MNQDMANEDAENNRSCFLCKSRCVTKAVQCENCEKWFHNSCSTKCSKKCCEKQRFKSNRAGNLIKPANDLVANLEVKDDVFCDDDDSSDSTKIIIEALKFENKLLNDMNRDQKILLNNLTDEVQKLKEDKFYLENKLHNAVPDWKTLEETILKMVEKSVSSEILKISAKLDKMHSNFPQNSVNSQDTATVYLEIESGDKPQQTVKIGREVRNSSNKQKISANEQDDPNKPAEKTKGQTKGQKGKATDPNFKKIITTPELRPSTPNVNNDEEIKNSAKVLQTSKILQNNFTLSQVSYAINDAINDAANIVSGEENEQPWKTVKYRKKGTNLDPKVRPAAIKGTKENVTGLKTATVKNYSWLFLSRLAVETEPADVESYLKSNNVFECECEKIKTKKLQKYTSFKIGVPTDDASVVLDADFWPKGAIINKFLNLRKIVPLRGQKPPIRK